MKILVTGSAGFIGHHMVTSLIPGGHSVVGIDSLNNYYDVNLKYSRLKNLGIRRVDLEYGEPVESTTIEDYTFIHADTSDRYIMEELFKSSTFDIVIHLAAQAGVRYSLENPYAYTESNISGFITILEGCRRTAVKHLVYASSSSVYGMNTSMPFTESQQVDNPVSLYAATKKSNELMAHSYSNLYNMPVTGLRFFTVYGPWGRPDMAYYSFTDKIFRGEEIELFNHGKMKRDFTFIDDIVDGISRVMYTIPGPNHQGVPYRVYNIGNDSPVELLEFVQAIEQSLGRKADIIYRDMQPGDVPATWADITDLAKDTGFRPVTSIQEGISRFVSWYLAYHDSKKVKEFSSLPGTARI